MKIQTIFEAFEQFQLGVDAPTKLYSWIVSGLQKVFLCFLKWKSNFMIWTRSINAYKSAKVPNREILKDMAHLCINCHISGWPRGPAKQMQKHPKHWSNIFETTRETDLQIEEEKQLISLTPILWELWERNITYRTKYYQCL